jgi:hypothetical protein
VVIATADAGVSPEVCADASALNDKQLASMTE